jgi:hypothetical protein
MTDMRLTNTIPLPALINTQIEGDRFSKIQGKHGNKKATVSNFEIAHCRLFIGQRVKT